MRTSFGKLTLYLLGGALLGGCVPGPTTPVELDLAGVKASPDVSDLAAVLAEAVTEDGRVGPDALRRMAGRLDAQLRLLAVTGPTATPALYPTYGSRWAYWYNARAAWSLKLAAMAGCPRQTAAAAMCRRPFRLDGRKMSLAEIDRILLSEARRSGDFRLAACAPGMLLSFAPMPRRPWSGDELGHLLGEALSRLVQDRRRFVIDVAKKKVRVPPMLWACRDLVRKHYQSQYGTSQATLMTALRPHLDQAGRRRLEEALGYQVTAARLRGELAVPRRKIYFPGKIGKVEP